MNNSTPHFTEHVITYPCWDQSESMLIKVATDKKQKCNKRNLHVRAVSCKPATRSSGASSVEWYAVVSSHIITEVSSFIITEMPGFISVPFTSKYNV